MAFVLLDGGTLALQLLFHGSDAGPEFVLLILPNFLLAAVIFVKQSELVPHYAELVVLILELGFQLLVLPLLVLQLVKHLVKEMYHGSR